MKIVMKHANGTSIVLTNTEEVNLHVMSLLVLGMIMTKINVKS